MRDPGIQLNVRNASLWEDKVGGEAKALRKWEAANPVYGPIDTIERNTFLGLERKLLKKQGYFNPEKRPVTASTILTARTETPKNKKKPWEGYTFSNVMGGLGGEPHRVRVVILSRFALSFLVFILLSN